MLGKLREHGRTNLDIIVKCEHHVRPSVAREGPV